MRNMTPAGLKAWRESHGWTAYDASVALDCSKRTYNGLEASGAIHRTIEAFAWAWDRGWRPRDWPFRRGVEEQTEGGRVRQSVEDKSRKNPKRVVARRTASYVPLSGCLEILVKNMGYVRVSRCEFGGVELEIEGGRFERVVGVGVRKSVIERRVFSVVFEDGVARSIAAGLVEAAKGAEA